MNVDREAAFDYEVRRYAYDHVMNKGLPPTTAETSSMLSTTPDDVAASFRLPSGFSPTGTSWFCRGETTRS